MHILLPITVTIRSWQALGLQHAPRISSPWCCRWDYSQSCTLLSWQCAALAHYSLLQHVRDDDLDAYSFPVWCVTVLPADPRASDQRSLISENSSIRHSAPWWCLHFHSILRGPPDSAQSLLMETCFIAWQWAPSRIIARQALVLETKEADAGTSMP